MNDVMIFFELSTGRKFMVKYNLIISIYENEDGGCYLNYVNSPGDINGVAIKQNYESVQKTMGDAYHFLNGDK
ncbi:MAG: hypothetical protein GY928_21830 [Colwellia sp.]|nr:hypothetical protein [Colwellia sp.]